MSSSPALGPLDQSQTYTTEEINQDAIDLTFRCPVSLSFPIGIPTLVDPQPTRDIPFRLPGSNQVYSLETIDYLRRSSRNGHNHDGERDQFGIDPDLPNDYVIRHPVTRVAVNLRQCGYPIETAQATLDYWRNNGGNLLHSEVMRAAQSYDSRNDRRVIFQTNQTR